MNIELSTIARCHVVMPWLGQLVVNRSGMIGVLAFGIIDLVELPQHAGEVGLTLRQVPAHDARGLDQGRHPEVFAVDHLLGLHQLTVELRKRQPRWQPVAR